MARRASEIGYFLTYLCHFWVLIALIWQVYAWKIADAMLHEKKDLESCYFAAQTMRTKVQLNFNELPKESHDSLRDSLMEHISQVSDQTNIVIVTQVCINYFIVLLFFLN